MPLAMMTRGAKSGSCNICGNVGPLTEDHTPPKGCVRPTAMELQHVTHRLDAEKAIKTKAQDGVKYRTLCARCNNALLGGRYDPAMIDFVNRVSVLLASNLVLPNTIPVPAKPALLVRAAWGHLAAVGVDRYLKGPRTEEWRDFFLDETLPLPVGVNFYYWVYPYRRQALIRDAGSLDIRGPLRAMYWLMKFYPMAFAVWMPENSYTLEYRDLAAYRTAGPDDVVDVMIDLEPIPHELILEAPTTTQAIMFGRDSVVANSRPPRGRILRV
ncbi:hypothetical protein J2X04_001510 [Lysobacter niabensis]|uniref:HNH endonuclease n=1 Tax=Agrilutibacter niabensis TaxID=380628 RepID=A0ABU1VPX7_9GAMM|nr:hypothetical protein [Lysobacter niabensis]MDR7099163.1 hypothetical protein [Lysobacter niabensis]